VSAVSVTAAVTSLNGMTRNGEAVPSFSDEEALGTALANRATVDEHGLPVGDQARRQPRHCDAVLRLPGESTGADNDVRIARERGIPAYHSIDELPRVA
jgi:hypothetical protein